MTYVAVLRSADAEAREVAQYEPEMMARVARACPSAKCVARGNSSSKCLDLFETPDDATASTVCTLAFCRGITDALMCAAVPWDLFATDVE